MKRGNHSPVLEETSVLADSRFPVYSMVIECSEIFYGYFNRLRVHFGSKHRYPRTLLYYLGLFQRD